MEFSWGFLYYEQFVYTRSDDQVKCALGDDSGMEKIKEEQNVSCGGTYEGNNKPRFVSLKYLYWRANFTNHPVENLSILFNYTL